MVPALQSGCYEIIWERCADLPTPMYNISAVLHDKKVYIMAGASPDYNAYEHVYCYNITTDQWKQLPSPGHYMGALQTIDSKLIVIGGRDNVTDKITNKVSTYINNNWTDHFPNLLRARNNPGVVSHSDYVIVVGGVKSIDTIYDDIEVLNTTQPSQWLMSTILLPKPMWGIFPTISNNMMLIVGYNAAEQYRGVYRLPVDKIISFMTQQDYSDQPTQWMELPSAPHCSTITIPNSHPPVIIGGHDLQYVPTSSITMLDDFSLKWKRVSFLSSPRHSVAAVSIDPDTILIIGGCTGGEDVVGAKTHSITTVEKGTATLTQRAAAIPTEGTKCSIQ